MPRPASYRIGIAALTLASACAFAGCGSDPDESATGQGAPGESGSTGSGPASHGKDGKAALAKGDGSAQTPDAAAEAVTFAALADQVAGAIEQGRGAAVTLTTRVADIVTDQTGHIDYMQDPVALKLSMKTSDGEAPGEAIIVDGALYSGMGDGQYVKADVAGDGASALDLTQFDPRDAMQAYAPAVDGVRALEPREVAGETLVGFEASVDTVKALGSVRARSGLPDSFSYTVWFDQGGDLARVETDIGKGGTALLVYEDWGRAVKIAAPSASQIMELPEIPAAR